MNTNTIPSYFAGDEGAAQNFFKPLDPTKPIGLDPERAHFRDGPFTTGIAKILGAINATRGCCKAPGIVGSDFQKEVKALELDLVREMLTRMYEHLPRESRTELLAAYSVADQALRLQAYEHRQAKELK